MSGSARRGLFVAVLVLFQSHWLDDVGSGESDTAGIAVSALGSAALLVGLLASRALVGRILLRAGLAFVIFISVADLVGLRPDGTREPDLLQHWTSGLGVGLVVAVAATLVCASALLVAELRAARPPG